MAAQEERHPKEEMTLVLVKPDGVKRGLTGEIIKRLEQRGLKVIALAMEQASKEKMDNHYPKSKEWISRIGEKTLKNYTEYKIDPVKRHGTSDPYKIGLEVRGWLLDYMISGPVVKMVVKGIHAIDMVRKLAGTTLPYKAELGSIRGDFSADSPVAANKDKRAIHNLVHASETQEEAAHEIAYWFKKSELCDYKRIEEDLML
ncbi:MAG TPA: nucleoside-diphosphate kinase [Nanoarchaeota archaeon]|nr:nucleoside-diphosphate kinase [Candidatus Pacearchaeota archaeon]HIH17303.1 nucleoside-diphosphate kinase [Nanoarchaeota archaeon]HIH34433.1 nucleoside-diphosphate kinase [Nanoarchaeota archaeon]HIH65590.1 nucleoside-diphosphate kinase [Nanoarchaeota archaeon]